MVIYSTVRDLYSLGIVHIRMFVRKLFLRVFLLYIKYSYVIQVISTRLYSFLYFYQILIILKHINLT